MVQFKRSLVLSTCFLSGTASIISFVSLFTQGWIYFDGRFPDQSGDRTVSTFNYGLFGGTYYQKYGSLKAVDISMTCSYSNNICAVLCAKSSDRRSELLDELYDGKETTWSLAECPQTESSTDLKLKETKVRMARSLYDSEEKRTFINAFAYLFTMIFLIISCVFGLICAGLSVWNTAANPVEVYFNIFGLYIYNGVAFGSLLIAQMIWFIMYCSTLSDHPSFIMTIQEKLLADSVSLGWSYWINMVSLLLYASSIGMLYLRNVLLAREPQLKVEIEDNAPAGILLF